ncbi:MAG: hypothetical protein WC465_04580 [Patescibacteria group bacterium]
MEATEFKTQMPLNQGGLIHMSFFVGYCQDNGLKIDKNTLEELHKHKLVFPALKVYLGVVEFKRVYASFNGLNEWRYIHPKDLDKFKIIKLDRKNYYCIGSLGKLNDHWLDYYFDNNMVEWPSQQKSFAWKQRQFSDFYTSASAIKKQYEFLYDKKQILAIKIALPYLIWIKEHKNDIDRKKIIASIQKRIADLYKFLEIYHEMEKIHKLFEKKKREKYTQYREAYGHKPSKIEWGQEYDFDISPIFKERAKKILDKYKLTKEFIYDWREFISKKSLINESARSNKIKTAYIKSLNDNDIASLEDTHYMIYIINAFLYFLTEKEETVKQVLTGFINKTCPICKSNFKPRNKWQITCGSIACVKAHRNDLKRSKRKIAKIS